MIKEELKNLLCKNVFLNFQACWCFVGGRWVGQNQHRNTVGWSHMSTHKKLTLIMEWNMQIQIITRQALPISLPWTKGKTHSSDEFPFLVCGIFKYHIKNSRTHTWLLMWTTKSPKPLEPLKLFYATNFWPPLLHQMIHFLKWIIRKTSIERVCLDWMAAKVLTLLWLEIIFILPLTCCCWSCMLFLPY